jgi:hypothetical protein
MNEQRGPVFFPPLLLTPPVQLTLSPWKVNSKITRNTKKMPPCHQNCTIRNLLRLAKKEIDNLDLVREDLDDLCFNEPGRLAEVTAKLKVVAEIKDRKMADARTLITYTEFGCELCHPEVGLILE